MFDKMMKYDNLIFYSWFLKDVVYLVRDFTFTQFDNRCMFFDWLSKGHKNIYKNCRILIDCPFLVIST